VGRLRFGALTALARGRWSADALDQQIPKTDRSQRWPQDRDARGRTRLAA